MVEAHERPIGARRQRLPDPARGQRVERLGDLREVLARAPLRAGMDVHAVVVVAPEGRVGAGGDQIAQRLAAEAVLAHTRHAALDARFVARMAHPGRIDREAAGLRILAEGPDDARMQRVGRVDARLGVIGDEDREDAPKNAQAASHASIALAVVSPKHGYTTR